MVIKTSLYIYTLLSAALLPVWAEQARMGRNFHRSGEHPYKDYDDAIGQAGKSNALGRTGEGIARGCNPGPRHDGLAEARGRCCRQLR
jgi:hypothetical protein